MKKYPDVSVEEVLDLISAMAGLDSLASSIAKKYPPGWREDDPVQLPPKCLVSGAKGTPEGSKVSVDSAIR